MIKCRNGHPKGPEDILPNGGCRECQKLARRRFRENRRLGRPLLKSLPKETLIEKIQRNCKRLNNGCLEWQLAIGGETTAVVSFHGTNYNVRKVLHGGEFTPLQAFHMDCGNGKCVEKTHWTIRLKSDLNYIKNWSKAGGKGRQALAGRQRGWWTAEALKHKHILRAPWLKYSQDSEDVWQNLLIKLVKNDRERVPPPSEPFVNWLRSALRNTWIDYLRQRRRIEFHELIVLRDIEQDAADQDFDQVSVLEAYAARSSSQPEVICELRDEVRLNLRRLDWLAPQQRYMIKAFIEDLSQKDLSETFGISENTVEQHLQRARRRVEQMASRKSRWNRGAVE